MRYAVATTAVPVEQVSTLLQENCRLITRQVARQVVTSMGISHDSAHKIITADLNKWKLATSPFVLLVFADIAKKVIRSEKVAHRWQPELSGRVRHAVVKAYQDPIQL